jgi:hypothetical protein
MLEWVKNNPVVVGQVVLAVVGVAAAFGLDVDADVLIGVLAVVGIPVTVVQRKKVTPVRKKK